jgi:tRNA threonylcarbamoyladenosine biosynthesis protein TsaB
MRVLTIDTSTAIGIVGTVDGDRLVCSLQSCEQNRHAEHLLDLVQSALQQSCWQLSDLDLVACTRGPGSFTGVRVGMATAKGLALATGLPLVGIVSLEAMAHGARRHCGEVTVAPMLDAKKNEVFAALYGPLGGVLVAPTHLPCSQVRAWLSSFAPQGVQGLVVSGAIGRDLDLPPFPILSQPDCDRPSALSVCALAISQWAACPTSQLDDIDPLYIRPPDAQLPRCRQ